MQKNILGAQMFTVREHTKNIKDFAATIQKIRDIGYTVVQISGTGPLDPKEVAKIVKDAGITVAITHMGWPRFLNELDKVIEEHKLWDCKHTAIGGLPPEYLTKDGITRFIEELCPVAEKLAGEGMDFSYHNHSKELVKFDGKTWLETLFEKASPEMLKAEIDTYWIAHGGGDPVLWVTKCANRMPVIHLKDMSVTPEQEQKMAPIGEGNLNWDAILKAAKESNVEWYLIEQDQCYDRDPFECLASSFRFLKSKGLS